MFKQLYEQGVVVLGGDNRGTNSCATQHSEACMRGHESPGRELLEFMPGAVCETPEQDV